MWQRFSSNKCKTQCKLCVGRIKLVRNKKQIMVKNMRKEIADLLRTSKQENARIRVETVIRENLLLQAFEVLELFMELLAVRAQLVEKSKDMPPDMIEALSSLVYSAQRLQDFPELIVIRAQLGGKYGKEYIAEASSDLTCRKWRVNENLIRCLSIEAPPPEQKLETLSDIAQEHGIEWDAAGAASEMLPSGAPQGFGQGGPGGQDGPPPGQWGGPGPRGGNSGGGGLGMGAPTGPTAAPDRFSGFQTGAPKVLPGQLETGKTLPNQVQAKAKEEWADAMSAAAAAAEHARRAQDASDAAERYARGSNSSAAPMKPSGGAGEPPSTAGPSSAAGPSTPAQDEFTDLPSLPPKVPGRSAQGSPQRFVKRTDSEIQRAYDAAVGPPQKKDAAAGPPSAPPAPPPAASLPRPASPSLPSPPPTGPNAGGAAAGSSAAPAAKPGNDLDELQKRFDMLKGGR
ncbi:g13088 [Coccomyxa viridis]|uniref:G13088 protein n=1 Tax=Coccomyxa viridis TaxID=1274662 RepID=A0ABP1GBY0_9CHLO